MENNKTITFLSEDEALSLVPKPNSILIAIREFNKNSSKSTAPLKYQSGYDNIHTFFFFDYCKYRGKPTWSQSLIRDGWVLFDKKIAADIIKFVEANNSAQHIYIHCAAGISRSAAVAKFFSDIWDIPLTEIPKHYNKTIYGILMETGYKLGYVPNALYKKYLIDKFDRQYTRIKQLNKLPNNYTYVTST